MKDTQRTPYGQYVDLCNITGSPVVINTAITMNRKFTILPDELPPPLAPIVVSYATIGNGGYGRTNPGHYEEGDIPVLTGRTRRPEAMSLYNHIPFAVKPVYDDLSFSEQNKYRLKKEMVIDGVNYFVYWALKIEPPINPLIDKIDLSEGSTIAPFTPAIDVLSPPYLAEINVSQRQDYIQVATACRIHFTESIVDNIKQAALIMYGNEDRGVVREIGLCTGADKGGEGVGVSLYNSVNINSLLGTNTITPGILSLTLGTTDVIYLPG